MVMSLASVLRSTRGLAVAAALVAAGAASAGSVRAQEVDDFGAGDFGTSEYGTSEYGGEPAASPLPSEPASTDPGPTTLTQAQARPSRVDVQEYLDLQERYARNLSQPELATKAAALQQAVRNQEVARRVAKLEEEVRQLLGDAINTPSEQTVTDLMKVLEARYSVPRGQQVYFEKKYRQAPRTSAPAAPSTQSVSPQSTTRAYPPQPSTPTYQAPSSYQPTPQRHHPRDARLLRAVDRLCRHEDPALDIREVP